MTQNSADINVAVVADLRKLRVTKAKEQSHLQVAKVDENAKRKVQLINAETWQILKDTIGHFIFYLVLSVVMYNQKDDKVFTMLGGVRNIVQVMPGDDFAAPPMLAGADLPGTNTLGTPSGEGYNAISSQGEFWDWAIESLPPLFETDSHGRLIYGGGELHLLGGLRVRQLRVKPEACEFPNSMTPLLPNQACNAVWDKDNNADGDMANFVKKSLDVEANRQYSSSEECPTFRGYFERGIYDSCGYIQDFGNGTLDSVSATLATLRKERWLDILSRLIVVEFTVYNPALDHLVTAALGVEFPPTGGAISSGGFRTHKVNRYPVEDAWGYVLCEFFILFTSVYVAYRCIATYKEMNVQREACHASEQTYRNALVSGRRFMHSATGPAVPYDFELDDLSVSFGGPHDYDILIELVALDKEAHVNTAALRAASLAVVTRRGLRCAIGVEGGWRVSETTMKIRISNFLRSSQPAEEARVAAAQRGMSDAIMVEYLKRRQHDFVWFTHFGNVMDVLLILLVAIMIGLNAERWVQMQKTLEAYTEHAAANSTTTPEYFGAFQDFRRIDAAIEFVNGCLMFIGLMKFCWLLRHNTKVKRCIALVQLVGSTVLGSLALVLAVLAIYSTTGHLMLGSGRPAFASWIGACSELFSTLVGKVSYDSILSIDGNASVNPVITQVFFTSYAIVNIFIVINMFISILNDAFEVVRDIPESEHDIFAYFWRLATKALGLSGGQQPEKVRKDIHTSTSAVSDALEALDKKFAAFEARSTSVLANAGPAGGHGQKRQAPEPGRRPTGTELLHTFREKRESAMQDTLREQRESAAYDLDDERHHRSSAGHRETSPLEPIAPANVLPKPKLIVVPGIGPRPPPLPAPPAVLPKHDAELPAVRRGD